jgi:hypothetical protein
MPVRLPPVCSAQFYSSPSSLSLGAEEWLDVKADLVKQGFNMDVVPNKLARHVVTDTKYAVRLQPINEMDVSAAYCARE